MGKSKKENYINFASEIPPKQEIKSVATVNNQSRRILQKERKAVLAILRYLHSKDISGHDPSKYHSVKKMTADLDHIKNIKRLLDKMIAVGYVQKSHSGDKIRISFKGLGEIIQDTYLD